MTDGCRRCQESLSSWLDGEEASPGPHAVTHLSRCASCQRWWEDVQALHRQVRLRPADDVPDLTGAILERSHPPAPGRGEWVRCTLAAVAATELVLSISSLLGHDPATSVHVARHLGALSAAYAIGLLYVAWRPARAFGVLPMVAALAACMSFTAVLDISDGRVPILGEAHHVLEVAALILVWLLAGSPGRFGRRRRTGIGSPSARAPLRVVR